MTADRHDAAGAPSAAAVVLHPHPAMGGDRHHPLVVAVAEGLAAAGVTALRPDLIDPGVAASAAALEAIAEDLRADAGVERIVLVGYSWGAVVSLRARPAGLAARAIVAPPVSMLTTTTAVPDDEVPLLVQVPAHDQYGPPDAVAEVLGDRPATTIEVVDGCDHFLVGAVARIAARTVAWVTTT